MKRKWRFISFKLCDDDPSFVEIDKCGVRDCSFEDFCDNVPEDGARWIIYDFEYSKIDTGKELFLTKIILIIYTPQPAPIKHKTTITYQKQLLKQNITAKTGVNPSFMEYKANSHSDINY